jgi:hypothetical protein
MCKEMPVNLVNRVVDPKRIIGKKWRAGEEERHKEINEKPKEPFCVKKFWRSEAVFKHLFVGGSRVQSSTVATLPVF